MIASRLTLTPVLGQLTDLRSSLKEITEHRQSLGNRTSLAETIWSPLGTRMHVTTLFDSLAHLEDVRNKGRDERTAELIEKATEHTVEPGSQTVWESVVSPSSSPPASFVLRVELQPDKGKAPEVRKVMTSWCDDRIAKGNTIALLEELFGKRGVRFLVRLPYGSIADAAASRAETLADPAYAQLGEDLAPLLGEQPSWELSEVIVPINS